MFTALIMTAAAAPADAEPTRAAPVTEGYYPGDKSGETDEKLDEKLKEALTAVKKAINIDEKIYTQFNYNYYPGDDFNLDNWYFNWNANNKYISVTLAGKDIIVSYSKEEYDEKYYNKNVKLAEISKADAKNKADAFLKKMLGDDFNAYRLYYNNLYYPSDRYNLAYVLTKNGYDYTNYQLSIDVNKITGEIVSFYRNGYPYIKNNETNIKYQDASKVISQETALKSYLDKVGLDLIYTSSYDWQTKELTVKPVYRLKNNYNEYISAVSGELITVNYSHGYTPLVNPSPEVAEAADSVGYGDGGGGVMFSEAELAGMKNAKDYITSDKAIEIIIKAFDIEIDVSNFQKHSYLYSDYMDNDKYIWNISLYRQTDRIYESYYANIDAKTGTVIYYSGYSYPVYYDYDYGKDKDSAGLTPIYNYDIAKKMVLEKVKELCPVDFDSNFELTDFNKSVDESEKGSFIDGYYYFYFTRKVNGIFFESNNIYASFDNYTGKITSYGFNWYENAEFPALDNIIPPETALKNIAGYCGYNIYYTSDGLTDDGKMNAILIYSFDNYIMADPFTGKCLDWNLQEAEKPEPLPDYKDLNGHWSEKIVKTLTDNGIYVWGGEKFEPGKEITRGEFIKYLRFFIYNSYTFTQMDSSIFVNPYIFKYDLGLDKDLDKIITKQEAAKIICEIAGYGELGKHLEIFRYPFNDNKVDDEYKGYVAIIKAFGLILGDDKGNYNGTENLKRSEAASIIYNIVMSFNK